MASSEGQQGGPILLVDVEAFGRHFKDMLPGLAEDLVTLEKEGATYAHIFNHEIDEFQYCRIPLLPAEILQFVEAAIAQQEFDEARAASASFDRALSAITNPRVRELVRAYVATVDVEGRQIEVDIRGCYASFLPP